VKPRWRWAASGLLVVAAGAVLVVNLPSKRAALALPAAPAASSSAAVSSNAAPVPEHTVIAASVSIAGNASAPLSSQAPGEFVEVCGVGRFRRSDLVENEPPPAWVEAMNKQHQQAREALLARLAGGTASQRVTAAMLGDDIQSAAQLAAGSGDVAAYRMALRACRQNVAVRVSNASRRAWLAASAATDALSPPARLALAEEPTACAMLSIEQLEVLDPTDATPVLLRLQDAVSRADRTGVSQALFQIVQGARLQANPRAFGAAVLEVVGAEPTPSESMIVSEAMGKDLMLGMDGSVANIAKACSVEALRDANLRQVCEQAVRRMPDLASSLMDARMMYSLEERLALPHSPKSLSKEDLSQAIEAMNGESFRWIQEPNCANLSLFSRHIASVARDGELARVQRLMKQRPPVAASAPVDGVPRTRAGL